MGPVPASQAQNRSQPVQLTVRAFRQRQKEARDTLTIGVQSIAQRAVTYRDLLDQITKDPLYLERKATSQFGRRWPIP